MKSTSFSKPQNVIVFNKKTQQYEVYVNGELRGLARTYSDAQRISSEVKKK